MQSRKSGVQLISNIIGHFMASLLKYMFNAVLTEFLMISKDAFVALKVKLCEGKFRKKSEFLIQQTIFLDVACVDS